MELRHLAAFVAVAEELHFGRAAERLHVAQSPLSRRIRTLEDELGAQLFERSTRSVALTAQGDALLEHARRLLDEAALAERAVRAAGHGEVGRVSIGFAGASSYDVLPLLTRAVTSELAGIELVLRGQTYSGQALNDVADGRLDIGFAAVPVRTGLDARVVRLERIVVALPDRHRLAGQESVALAELASEPFVSFPAAGGSAVRDAAHRACFDAGFTPRIAQEAPDSYTMLTLVGAEVGVALMVSSAQRIHTGHVVFRPLSDEPPALPIALAWRADNPSRALRAVLDVAERVLPTAQS
ncbi:LysR family transcriptional regulator YnfL [Pseudonocardia sp. Ae168_Ps1]|uniref:LysR substrate-binding domain-containing protein n=1 Tax=unclassified Pseudonocardia TaxID=2619320 RepID=UPI00094B63A7|nr:MULTISPECIES: LysR substrate-binding domain-containing protein [unclassified Pseudonocardia]OLL71450.1 LysR family transcriptional regulator YnfL [Pseudonocardia sp. Ae168_Ps1]OLL77002.1 LysR family transcriptional regulator YnfL [Pseudonocardia sp. Ae150A_Ps1]OLL88886.1 LysR family transcriptional regulator YnfL [Pseudonocardia sp. Ae263_Ps1]OLL91089.1 LysR family transcriptional regulator YnfL [Pseudonocardia sp. Ae356_Ps1]